MNPAALELVAKVESCPVGAVDGVIDSEVSAGWNETDGDFSTTVVNVLLVVPVVDLAMSVVVTGSLKGVRFCLKNMRTLHVPEEQLGKAIAPDACTCRSAGA
jgi:hypothetical protein